jgi:bifunctional DNA-binding transcriptional regulator/antitoxin component of YhaV-PrlF toxin-antitoxin module
MPTAEESMDEMPFVAEVIKGGRITIPEEIRKLMRVDEGNYVLIKLKILSRKRIKGNSKHHKGNGES